MMLTGLAELALHFAAAAVLCAGVIAWLLRSGWAERIALDEPNHRSLHAHPVPRIGGWGLVPAALLCGAWAGGGAWLGAGALALAAVSWLDDRRGLSSFLRLALHGLVAVACVGSVLAWPSFLVLAGVALAVVWGTNLFNFMDGSNGMAGGMAVSGFGAYALAAALAGEGGLAAAAAAFAGAGTGFLRFNFPRARVFLGDAGSIPCGFMAGALGVAGWARGVWPEWFPVLVFAPFVADASVTLGRRIWRRERFWEAHRDHYYQRLVQSGAGHVRTAFAWYAAMALCAGGALLALHENGMPRQVTIAGCFAAVFALGLWADRRWRAWKRG